MEKGREKIWEQTYNVRHSKVESQGLIWVLDVTLATKWKMDQKRHETLERKTPTPIHTADEENLNWRCSVTDRVERTDL